MKNISSKEADSIFYGNFFDGYTEKVVLISEKIEKSILQDEYNEFIIFAGGLNVDNIDLSNNYHSIYAVKGLIETQTLILGDCVFAISGQLIVG